MSIVKKAGLLLIVLMLLTACGIKTGNQTADSIETESAENSQNKLTGENGEGFLENLENRELSPAFQLAVGTLLLEDTELALGLDQVEILIPFWKLYVNLLESDTTAPEELGAIVNEIQAVMTTEQMIFIVDLELVQEDVVPLMNELGIDVSLRADGEEGGIGRNRPEGLPEGTRPGGGAGGGIGAVDGLDPELLATREARREEMGGIGEMGANRLQMPVIEALIELLEGKIEN
ncbi:MAG TPA: hypothetical protein ENG59_01660 [Chloroflexi bacterium]|nr:MAG: hypothetical protein DRI46_00090 [Chloroflexota bacterium]HDD54935.1 hypothetical protein [Chloroflexota bacterium]